MKYIHLIILSVILIGSTHLFSQSTDIKIMSFNIQQPYGTNWDDRKDSVVKTIIQENADIIGTQEAINNQRNYIMENTATYTYYGLGRDGGDNGEGCWILYKTGKYLIDSTKSGNFWLSDTPEKPSRFDGDYNRICTYVYLTDTATMKSFYLFNAHFPTPNLTTGRMQSMQLMAKVMAEKSLSGVPVIATGDFNSSENDVVTKWMKSGKDNPIQCRDTYREVYPEGNVTTGFGTKYDYIYVENITDIKTNDSWVVTSPRGASDHFAIIAEVSFFFESNSNQHPIAHAGFDQFIVDSVGSGVVNVFLNAGLSYDPDGYTLKAEWALHSDTICRQISSTVELPVGDHPIFVTITDDSGAQSTDQVLIKIIEKEVEPDTTNVEDHMNNTLLIYPNPASNYIHIKSQETISTITIFDMNGKAVKRTDYNDRLYIGDINIGVYFIELKTQERTFYKRIVKN